MLKDFTAEKFDIIIQAGQSNAKGSGHGDVQNPFRLNERIWYLNRNFTISLAQERVWDNKITGDFSLSFADEYIRNDKLKEGSNLLIIRAAEGGTGFSDKRWGLEDDLFKNMMEMVRTALTLNPENRLVAFLWHQGETDKGTDFEIHYKNLIQLVNSVRMDFNCKDLPFIAGDFVHDWKDRVGASCEPVIRAVKRVCEDINGRFVETDNLQSNGQALGTDDTIHFSREALRVLGMRYYSAWADICI